MAEVATDTDVPHLENAFPDGAAAVISGARVATSSINDILKVGEPWARGTSDDRSTTHSSTYSVDTDTSSKERSLDIRELAHDGTEHALSRAEAEEIVSRSGKAALWRRRKSFPGVTLANVLAFRQDPAVNLAEGIEASCQTI